MELTRQPQKEAKLQVAYQSIKTQEFLKRLKHYGPEAERIWQRGNFIGCQIFYYSLAFSCMELTKEYINQCYQAGNTPYSGVVFMAEKITHAKGRYNRKWFAPKGGLWFSLLLYPEVEGQFINLYPLTVGVACCEALKALGLPVSLKWVNDLMLKNRKLGGILTTHYFGPDKEPYLVFGIGINVNNFLPQCLKPQAISLKEFCGQNLDIDQIFLLTLANLIWYIGLLHEAEIRNAPQVIVNAWVKHSNCLGQKAFWGENLMKDPGHKIKILGIDPFGGLRVEFEDSHEVETIYSGEIILRDGSWPK